MSSLHSLDHREPNDLFNEIDITAQSLNAKYFYVIKGCQDNEHFIFFNRECYEDFVWPLYNAEMRKQMMS